MKNQRMECAEVHPRLTRYLTGDMAPVHADRIRAHLAECAHCREEGRALAATLDAVSEALSGADDPPATLSQVRRDRIRAARPSAFRRWIANPRVLARAAVFLLLLGSAATLLLPTRQVRYSRRSQVDVAMLDMEHALDFDGLYAAPVERAAAPTRRAREADVIRSEIAVGERDLRQNDIAMHERRRRPAAHADALLPGDEAADWDARIDTRTIAGRRAAGAAEMPPTPVVPTPDVHISMAAPPAMPDSPLVMRGLFAGRSEGGRQTVVRRYAQRRDEAPDDIMFDAMPESSVLGEGALAHRNKARTESAARSLPEPALAPPPRPAPPAEPAIAFNSFVDTARQPFSTFSMDVDTASYGLARAHIRAGRHPPPAMVRTEEFINALDFDYTPPPAGAFAIHADLLPSPFRPGLQTLRIGIKAQRVGRDQDRRAMLTLVIDTSGSMDTPDRMGRIREALPRLVKALGPEDEIAIVQFDRRARLALAPTPAAEHAQILTAIENLAIGGGTNLEAGLAMGYQVAARHFRSGGSNRVMLLTDGVANLGAVTADELLTAISGYRRQGIYLSVLGFGIGAYDDDLLKTLAQRGDGAYVFIDSAAEAQRVLVDELAASLHTVANDAKIQVEFNPARVLRYRQIGYERRQLAKEDFRDDTVDAGDVGSGQSVTALYEIELAPDSAPRRVRPIQDPVATVFIRYEEVETGTVVEQSHAVRPSGLVQRFEDAPPRARLAVIAAEFAEVLRGNPYSAGTTIADVIEQLRPVAEALPVDGQVRELLELAEAARRQPGW